MAKFAYNNTKNASTGYTPFELNCEFYLKVLFEKDIDPYFRSHSANKVVDELKELIELCYQNLFHA